MGALLFFGPHLFERLTCITRVATEDEFSCNDANCCCKITS
jgi:hypothetical protein